MMSATLIARLADLCPSLAEIEEPMRSNPMDRSVYPVASVHLAQDAPRDPHDLHDQRYEIRITARSDAQLTDARQEIHAALHDWRGVGAALPMRWVGGEVLAISGNLLQWRDLYSVATCSPPDPSAPSETTP